jgi:hypothetical protein
MSLSRAALPAVARAACAGFTSLCCQENHRQVIGRPKQWRCRRSPAKWSHCQFSPLERLFFMSTTGHNGNLMNLIAAPPLAFIGDREFGSAPAKDAGVCHDQLSRSRMPGAAGLQAVPPQEIVFPA